MIIATPPQNKLQNIRLNGKMREVVLRNIQIDTEVLRKIVQESVQEALKAERFNLYNSLIPIVSDNEMNEIIARLGEKPQPQSTVDYTEWFDNEN